MTLVYAIADDEPEVLVLLEKFLSGSDNKIHSFPHGEALLSSLNEGLTPDCFLLDVMMPRLDGFATAKKIRGLPRFAHTPLLFLTALSESEAHQRVLDSNADDFLCKPIRRTELLARIASLLRIKGLNDELRQVDKRKREYAAMVVHDLKNPVGNLELCVRQLERLRVDRLNLKDRAEEDGEALRQLEEDEQELLSDMNEISRIATARIRAVLDIASSDSGRLVAQKTTIDLDALFAEVLRAQKPMAQQRQIQLRSDTTESGALYGDPQLLRRALENLIDNALRIAPRGSEIWLRSREVGYGTELTVEDAGRGIPAQAKVFLPFESVPSEDTASQAGNYGLGLAFCRAAVAAHGGGIEAEALQPVGTRIRLTLPRQ